MKVVIDGRTATAPPGGYYFPEMVMDATMQPGLNNFVMKGMESMVLPRIPTTILQAVSASQTTMVTLKPEARARPAARAAALPHRRNPARQPRQQRPARRLEQRNSETDPFHYQMWIASLHLVVSVMDAKIFSCPFSADLSIFCRLTRPQTLPSARFLTRGCIPQSDRHVWTVAKTKKQHFVPQFLLRNFGHGKKKKERVWTFDKRRGVSYCAGVLDTGHQNGFYDGASIEGDEIEGESLTERVDGIGSRAFRPVVQQQRLPLQGEAFVSMSYFIAAQMLRTPTIRNEMEYLRNVIIERWGPEVREGDDSRGIGEYCESDSKFSSIEMLRDVPEFSRILQTKVWFLLLAPPDVSFILSDNPVVKHNHLDYGRRGSLGVAQDGIEIVLPISPKLGVQMLCPKIANLVSATHSGQERLLLQREGKPLPLSAQNVTFVNSLQVSQSERFLYAQSDIDFRLAREMLVDHPNLAVPASQKVVR